MTTAQTHGRVHGALRFLPALTLIAVLTITASAEFELARTVLALPPYIAWALPVAVDSYVLAALRSGRDVIPALAVMAGSLGASMGAHLAAAGDDPGEALPGHVVAPAATGIMTVLVVVAWRVHVLIEHTTALVSPHREPVLTVAVSDPSAGASPVAAAAHPSPRAVRAFAAEPQPPSEALARTDDEILKEIGTQPPSIRQLKRRYGIGQNRATRLHRAATKNDAAAAIKPSEKKAENTDQERDSDQQTSSDQYEPEEVTQQSARNREQETHPGITDRVGRPSPPVDGPAGAFKALSDGPSDPVEVRELAGER